MCLSRLLVVSHRHIKLVRKFKEQSTECTDSTRMTKWNGDLEEFGCVWKNLLYILLSVYKDANVVWGTSLVMWVLYQIQALCLKKQCVVLLAVGRVFWIWFKKRFRSNINKSPPVVRPSVRVIVVSCSLRGGRDLCGVGHKESFVEDGLVLEVDVRGGTFINNLCWARCGHICLQSTCSGS